MWFSVKIAEDAHSMVWFNLGRYLMPPSHLTFSRTILSLKVCLKNMASTPLTLSSLEPSWQRTWHGLKCRGFELQALTLPSVSRDGARI